MGGARVVAILGLVALAACSDVGPSRRMAHGARSERNPTTQVDDRHLANKLRSALADSDQLTDADITPHVYMGHVFLVGFVTHSDQQGEATKAVQDVDGVRSVGAYLPVRSRPAKSGSNVASDTAIEAKVRAALELVGQPVTRIDLQVLDGHVVLMGVVKSQEAVSAATAAARSVSGVTGVTSFLLLPEPGYGMLRDLG
ncbi:MAG TPA: BON domain-containing protein [Candidatus Binatia bacterium]|nr:BON domain-containing protein [Candidatus Binatia bacterium]